MESLKKYFDDFVFHARVMPILVVLLPILALGIVKGIIDNNVLEGALYIAMIVIFLTLTSRVARESGKRYENKMYKKLEGIPTTIILRYSDDTIDDLTKTRYHKKLNERVTDVELPLSIEDEDINSDMCYKSAINWLRVYANSNRDKEYRVYQELKEYNFWRNLYGTKIIAFFIYLAIAIRELQLIDEFNIQNMITKPYPEYVALIIMVLSSLFVLLINKKIVQRKAFDYAKALVEVCERL